jgi:ribosome-associated protein
LKEKTLTLNDVGSELRIAIEASLAKKAGDVVVLDLRELASFTDFFLLCTGNSKRQLKTIAESVEEALRKSRVKPNHIEGYPHGDWLLMDYVDFIVHIFTPRSRSHYDLERLWGDASSIEVESDDTRGGTGTASIHRRIRN